MKIRAQNAGLVFGNRQRAARAALACVAGLLAAIIGATPAGAQTYTETLLHVFTGPEGVEPGNLLAASNGDFYASAAGGAFGYGEIFKMSKTGALTVFHSFGPAPDGAYPGSLIEDAAGNLYGVTAGGGTYGHGTIFKFSPTGKETVLYNFTGGSDGNEPGGTLARDSAGNLYGTTGAGGTAGLGTVFRFSAAGVESVLHSFTGPPDGDSPSGSLLLDTAGNLYGATYYGGSPPTCYSSGCGIIFEITTRAQEIVLYNFTGQSDGENPNGGLIRDAAGNLYGTAANGGYGVGCDNCGTVWELSPKGKLTVVYAIADAANPAAGLIRDPAGNLYGTTWEGGGGPCYNGGFFGYGCGVVFEVSPSGQATVLHSFESPPDGSYPYCTLVRDSAGNLYGTTAGGGNPACDPPYGCGTVFKLTPQ